MLCELSLLLNAIGLVIMVLCGTVVARYWRHVRALTQVLQVGNLGDLPTAPPTASKKKKSMKYL